MESVLPSVSFCLHWIPHKHSKSGGRSSTDDSANLEIKVKQTSGKWRKGRTGYAVISIRDLLKESANGEGTAFPYFLPLSF